MKGKDNMLLGLDERERRCLRRHNTVLTDRGTGAMNQNKKGEGIMYIESTNTVNTKYQYRTAYQKTVPQKAASFRSAQDALRTGNTSNTKGMGFTLHINSGSEGDRMLSAVAGGGKGGMAVFEPADFNPEKPVYKVCTWDEEGSMTEHMVDVTKVNAADSDEASMFAYACYLSESGQYPEAADTFLRTYGYVKSGADEENTGSTLVGDTAEAAENVFRQAKRDWTKFASRLMQMQYDAGNLKGYLEYKKFADFFS